MDTTIKDGSKLKTLIYDLRNQGKSYKEIQQLLGCAKSTVSYYCSQIEKNQEIVNVNNCVKLNTISHGCNYELWTEQQLLQITDLINCGANDVEISKVTKIVRSSIKRFRKTIHCAPHRLSGYAKIKARRELLKKMLVIYLGGKCKKCGYDACQKALDFHHINPSEKEFSISSKIRNFDSLLQESDKCILLCSNCHQELHDNLWDINNLPGVPK